MAEQNSHNVVTKIESASAPLADVAATHTTTEATAHGAQDTSNPITIDEAASTKSQNSDAVAANGSLGLKDTGDDAVQPAAEPSAGDAAAQPADITKAETPAQHEQDTTADSASDQLPSGAHAELVEDSALHDTSAEPSVHSDTDTSRVDVAEQSKDGKRHVRTESVKKATTFSRVSVSKNFLAKALTPVPMAAKAGEKPAAPSAAASAALKPRLIAKTGASLIAQKARQNSDTPSGPDASKVWNKNRPTAPAPPKQFTDEELKQQYGIHLATRLQSDGEGKENKWADIDDEDDDWVPETVVWMDGTKTNITPAEATPAPKEAELAMPPPKKPVEIAKPALSIASKQNAPTGPPKTILRPGIAKTASGPTSNTGAEKATLKAKSPVATPVKSPWAPIPKVDTVPLVNPPTQYHAAPTPFATQDARAYEQAPPSGPPLPEMAPDAFDRALRGGDGRQRELFNSTNGRFEPASEDRRASRGSDSYSRKPALLQRPSQAAGAPAEPSAAFQTRTSSQTDGPPSWARRRGSSVSHGSGAPGRRMSTTRPHEPVFAEERRPSTVVGHDMSASPKSAKHEPVAPAFAQQNAWSQQMPPPPPPGAPVEVEDVAKLQEKIMKEKKEKSAKMREKRIEEEKQAEEARKARIAAKLAELGGAGMSRSEREAAAKVAAEQKLKDAAKPAAKTVTAPEKQSATTDAKAAPANPAVQASAVATAPSSVPAKVPSPEKDAGTTTAAKQPSSAVIEPVTSNDQATRLPATSHLSPAVGGRAPGQQQSPLSQKPGFSAPASQKQQDFSRSTSDIFTAPWPTAGSGNVWGSTGALGNGTFAPTLSGLPQIPNSMSRPPTSARISPQGLGQDGAPSALAQPPGFGDSRPVTANTLDARPDHFMGQSRANGASPTPGLGRQQHVPGPIAPPSRAQPNRDQRLDDRAKASGWNSYAIDGPQQYARAAEAAKATVAEAGPPTVLKETFKQTSAPSRLGGKRGVAQVQHLVHDADGSRAVPAPPSTQTQPAATSTASATALPASENTVRLPGAPAQQPLHAQRQAVSLPPSSESKEQSPPPPEAAGHPVHAGDAKHPHVRLPRPAPVVRLPPASPRAESAAAPPAAAPVRHQVVDGRARPLVESDAWKERFNNLFNRATIQTETPPSPPRTPPKAHAVAAAAVSSTTRADMDVAKAANATVSLPQQSAKKFQFTMDNSSEVISKPGIDDIFNEELSFGSKPRTRVPRNARYEQDMRFGGRVNLLHMGTNSKMNMSIEPSTRKASELEADFERDSKGCHVNVPGVKTRFSVVYWRNNRTQNVRPSPRPQKGKGSLGPAASAKDSTTTSSPASNSANGTPAPGSRKTSFQKAAPKDASNASKQDGATGEGSTEAPKERSGGWARVPRGPKRDLRPTGFVLPLQSATAQQT